MPRRRRKYRKAVRLTAQTGTHRRDVGPAACRRRTDRARSGDGPRREFPLHAQRRAAEPAAIRAIDIALTLHADHELNASTFAARVAAATLTDIYSAVVAGIATLKGPLHGGANAEVMKMLLELRPEREPGERMDEVDRAQVRAQGEDSGFGHRVYKHRGSARDAPAADVEGAREARPATRAWFDMSQRIEALVKAEKKLNPNVDFYSASTYYTLGIPIDLYTPIFAVSRMSGWTAHILEQYANNRLIRPRADYTGPTTRSASFRSSNDRLVVRVRLGFATVDQPARSQSSLRVRRHV